MLLTKINRVFFFCSQCSIAYIPCVGPLPEIKRPFFLLSTDELMPGPNIMSLPHSLPSDNENVVLYQIK